VFDFNWLRQATIAFGITESDWSSHSRENNGYPFGIRRVSKLSPKRLVPATVARVHVFLEDKRDSRLHFIDKSEGGMRLSMLALDCIPLRDPRLITNFVHQIPIIVGTRLSSRLT